MKAAKPDDPIFYVYEHWRVDKDVCFYVGKGYGRRAWNMKKRSAHHTNVVKKLSRSGYAVDVRIIASDLTEREALASEMARISYWRDRGSHLVNLTLGGEGVVGLVHSEATRKKLREASKQALRPPCSEETKEKIRAAQAGRPRGPNPEHADRLRGRKLSADHKAKISMGLTGRSCSEETRTKISAAQVGKTIPFDQREKMSAAQTGKKRDPASVKKQADKMKHLWATKWSHRRTS